MKNSSKSNLNKNNYSNHPILLELNMTPEEFEKKYGVSFDDFENDVDLSTHQLLEQLDLLEDETQEKNNSTKEKSNLKDRKKFSNKKNNKNSDSKIKSSSYFSLSKTSNNKYINQIKDIEDESISSGISNVRTFFNQNRYTKVSDRELEEVRTIAVACELAPAKTLIPILKLIRKFEKENSLNWKNTRIIGLVHGEGAEELIKPYCDDIFYIGQGRRANRSRNSKINLFRLIIQDIYKATIAMSGEQIDLLITCGNAGDVRKSIYAARLLRTPVLHIEQDIYNPIEFISYANLIVTTSFDNEIYLKKQYGLKNVKNIGGFPQAAYVHSILKSNQLLKKDDIIKQYGFDHYILVVLGGDLSLDDVQDLIPLIDGFDYPTLIAPYRFDKKFVEDLSNSDKVIILDNFVDVLSLSYHCDALIFGAGMGMTIEAGVLKVPSVKLYGFHPFHSSINLAKDMNIPIVQIYDIPNVLQKLYPPQGDIVHDGQLAAYKVVNLINNFDYSLKKGDFLSTIKIWRARSRFKKSRKRSFSSKFKKFFKKSK